MRTQFLKQQIESSSKNVTQQTAHLISSFEENTREEIFKKSDDPIKGETNVFLKEKFTIILYFVRTFVVLNHAFFE